VGIASVADVFKAGLRTMGEERTQMSENHGHSVREAVITRVFDAPPQLVWKAWTEPARFAQWFGTPPFTTPVSAISMDVRPSGEWRAIQMAEDGTRLPFVGTYREVIEPERLVFTFENPEDRSDPDIEVVTVTFEDLDGKTQMALHQEGHLPKEEYAKLREGYSLFFDRLAEHLARA
jgi:uncharacterized protein YndB with AHSA1/START domain